MICIMDHFYTKYLLLNEKKDDSFSYTFSETEEETREFDVYLL